MGADTQKPVEITYTLENEDYRALARFLLRDTPRGRRVMRRNTVSAIVLAISAVAIAFVLRQDIVLALLVGAFVLVLMQVLQRSATAKGVTRIYQTIRPEDERLMKEPGTLALSPEGVEAHYRKGSGTVPWQAVSQVGRDATHIFIILGKANAFVVPMREFPSPQDFETFYQAAVEFHAQAFARAPGA